MIPLPSNGKKFIQGIYSPRHPEKYVGKQPIRYLSSWELKFFRWCDYLNPNVLEWASEAVIIPYINPIDGKAHRYYTDGVLAIREGAGISKYVIEIKPSKQLSPPVPGKRKKQSTIIHENVQFITNNAKWEAARKWCCEKGYKFLILTEKELGIG